MKTHLPTKLVEKIDLPNNLVLELHDYSRRIAGDRWFVGLLARIPIEVSEEDFAGRPQELYRDFLEEQGPEIYVLPYMGHKSFAKGFIRRRIQEFEERQLWQKAMN